MSMNSSVNIGGIKFKSGDKIKCCINRSTIDDAKIYINEIGEDASYPDLKNIYICQNIQHGNSCDNKLGYDFSWAVPLYPEYIEEMKLGNSVADVYDIEKIQTHDYTPKLPHFYCTHS